MAIGNYSFKSIDQYLSASYTYHVPKYQRAYSWKEDSGVGDFWEDLNELVKEGREEHFLGLIVVCHENKENAGYDIIDGQQRTVTAVIMLSVMRDLFYRLHHRFKIRKANSRVEDITMKYIGRFDEEQNELKLVLSEADKIFFKENIQTLDHIEHGIEKPSNKSNERIKKAYDFFCSKLTEQLEGKDTPEEKYDVLVSYYTGLCQKFKVMYVETTDINEAYIIFETLNARGKDLTTSDLLKNHIFQMGGKYLETIQNNWGKMLEKLDGESPDRMIRYFWNSRHKFIRTKDLYGKIRDTVSNENDSMNLSNELLRAVDIYTALRDPDNYGNYFKDSKINKAIRSLRIMEAKSFYPVVIAMAFADYPEKSISRILAAIEILIFRNIIIAGKTANEYERKFAEAAMKLYGYKGDKNKIVAEVIKGFAALMISDDEFINQFSAYSKSSKKKVLRYILIKLNDSYSREIKTNMQPEQVNIEHIMPKKMQKWGDSHISEADHEKYLWRLGNLTLLGDDYNKKASNNVFAEKRAEYGKSDIALTKEVCDYDTWSIETILQRQKQMAKLAVKVWPILNA